MSSPYSILDNRPIDQWKVTELKEELKRRKLTTKGLKEDLVKRLDEAIRAEPVAEDANNGSDIPQSGPQTDQDRKGSGTANDVSDVSHPKMLFEEGKTEPFVSRAVEAAMDNGTDNAAKVDGNMPEDIDGNRVSVDEGDIAVGEGLNAGDSAPTEEKQVGQLSIVEPAVVVGETMAPFVSSNGQDLQHGEIHNGSGDLKPQLEKDDLSSARLGDDSSKSPHEDKGESRSPHANVSIISSGPSNQVSLVSPALGLEVKSDSVSSESISINENNELKDKIIADDIKSEPDVKPDSMQPSSTPIVPDDSKSNQMDIGEPLESKLSIEETGGKETEKVEIAKKNDIEDISSGEKLNLDRSSGDDSMEEDVLERKLGDSKSSSPEMGDKLERVEVKEDALVDIVGDEVSADTEVAVLAKRKLHDQSAVENNDVRKRQRRWNSETLKLSGTQSACAVASTTPKDTFDPTLKRSFSKSESTASEEAPKERVVPPSSKPPTNSLRIDRFLRPFTLKAVQDLLGKTGTVTSFWMDHIKTHCYVSYSSVEEAIETRNAVYNLQWPTNGGRLLIAEFVDPEEVKARIEAPPRSPATPATPATPASMTPSFPRVPPTGQSQPSPRQPVERQQLPPPPSSLPPPPLLSNPPPARENPPLAKDQLPPGRERPLPPPPPILEKVDPPIVTLDDLFRKTKATPRIYYLPLSDERVAAKLKGQGRISGSLQVLRAGCFSLDGVEELVR